MSLTTTKKEYSQKITVELSYYVSSKENFTKREAFDLIKNKTRAGVRYEEFNSPKKVK